MPALHTADVQSVCLVLTSVLKSLNKELSFEFVT